MALLIQSVEVYRVSTENEAKSLIEAAKADNRFVLKKYMTEDRERKAKGEIIDEWKRVTLTKVFDDEKEPEGNFASSDYDVADEISSGGDNSGSEEPDPTPNPDPANEGGDGE